MFSPSGLSASPPENLVAVDCDNDRWDRLALLYECAVSDLVEDVGNYRHLDPVCGFGSLSFYRDRPGYRTSVEDSVYVDRQQQGKGVCNELLALATSHDFHCVFARIVNQ